MALPLGLTEDALAAAEQERDLESLAAGQRMRNRFGPEVAAAALTQVSLRRRARTKFGDAADQMFFTRDGLEQASRPAVARHHARRFAAAGVRRVIDLGCGIGADALAFAAAGLDVRAVDRDPVTAEVARANLAARDGSAVELADAADVLAELSDDPITGWFADPSRRNAAGRIWREADFSPPWDVVLRLTDGGRPAGVKLGPALPHRMIPDGVEAEWVSQGGTTLEACLWAGPAGEPGRRRATVLRSTTTTDDGATATTPDEVGHRDDDMGDADVAATVVAGDDSVVPVGPVRRYVYEPDGAVIRAGAMPVLAEQLDATVLDPQIAYLTSERLVRTPLATAFEVLEELPHKESTLRGWVRERGIGTLEIKQRGIEEDPARLRRRLAPRGTGMASWLITRTPAGSRVLVVRRPFMR